MTVTTSDTIELNGQKYRIKGGVVGAWADPFPDQLQIGDASYSNRRDLSSWIINDLRGGIGVEEMDEKVDANRCWWTNCIIKYRNHMLPPRLATAITKPVAANVPTIVNGDMELTTGWDYSVTGVTRSSAQKQAGSYSLAITAQATSEGVRTTEEYLKGWTPGVQYTVTVFMYSVGDANHRCRFQLADGTQTISSDYVTAASWTAKTAQITLASTAQYFKIVLVGDQNGPGTDAGYFDTASITMDSASGAITYSAPSLAANFNGELYWTLGKVLAILNSGRTALETVWQFASSPTALVPSLNSRLYIYMGDSTNYYYLPVLTTFYPDGITQSNSANAYWGFQHDAKLFKCNSSGTVKYSTDPDGATPTWSSGGAITDIADQIEGFVEGRDASGNYVPYAATNSIIKAYDSTTPQWVDTEARLPNHPIGGKGHAYWNGKLYFSYGLGVKEYYPETGAFLDIGLTERDGLPVEYNGEIVKLLGDTGLKGMFAAIDASVTSGNSKSGLYLYDGYGWQCWWVDTSNNGAMHDIIVSSASSAYAVYWDCGTSIYYIDIPRGIENPDKISQSYATAGILITPWFDAGDPVAAKLAKVLSDYAKGITTTETVALKYRLDHTNTDLDTGWTTLDTLNTTGETGHNEELFGSGAGISFKAIQFRLDFVTPGSTAKPDIQSLVLYYRKRTGSQKLRIWNVTVICDNYGLTTAKQKVANLKSAIESATDVAFSYHPNDNSAESFYVTVNCQKFDEQTGREYEANYELTLIES